MAMISLLVNRSQRGTSAFPVQLHVLALSPVPRARLTHKSQAPGQPVSRLRQPPVMLCSEQGQPWQVALPASVSSLEHMLQGQGPCVSTAVTQSLGWCLTNKHQLSKNLLALKWSSCQLSGSLGCIWLTLTGIVSAWPGTRSWTGEFCKHLLNCLTQTILLCGKVSGFWKGDPNCFSLLNYIWGQTIWGTPRLHFINMHPKIKTTTPQVLWGFICYFENLISVARLSKSNQTPQCGQDTAFILTYETLMVGHPCSRVYLAPTAHIWQVVLKQRNGTKRPRPLSQVSLPTAKRWWQKQNTRIQKWPICSQVYLS